MTTGPKRITIPEVLPRFAAYYRENPAWGSLHVVLDDGNIGDDTVRYVVERAAESGDVEGEALGRLLLDMTKSQRGRMDRVVDEWVRERDREAAEADVPDAPRL